jgi:hypothetical protein
MWLGRVWRKEGRAREREGRGNEEGQGERGKECERGEQRVGGKE